MSPSEVAYVASAVPFSADEPRAAVSTVATTADTSDATEPQLQSAASEQSQLVSADDRLRSTAPGTSNAENICLLYRFRSAALYALWNTRIKAGDDPREALNAARAASYTGMYGGYRPSTLLATAPTAKHLSMMLLIPLLESQSRTDPDLCGGTVTVLLEFLAEASPTELQDGLPVKTRERLEALLCTWLSRDELSTYTRSGAIAALVALTCASGSYQSIANTIALLGGFAADGIIPVGKTIERLARNNERPLPLVLSPFASAMSSWSFDTTCLLEASESEDLPDGVVIKHPKYSHMLRYSTRTSGWNCDGGCGYRSSRSTTEMPRYRSVDETKDFDLCGLCLGNLLQQGRATIATDNHFIYAAGAASHGVVKIGTGHNGTLRGHVYGRAPSSLGHGLVTYGGGQVLFRPYEVASDVLCHMLDPVTLKPTRQISRPVDPPQASEHPKEDDRQGASPSSGGGAAGREPASPFSSSSPVRANRPASRAPIEQQPAEVQDLCFQVNGGALYHVYMLFTPQSDPKKVVPVMVDTYDLRGAQSVHKVKIQLGGADNRIVATFRSERNNAAPVVVSVEAESNAEQAGLQVGDRITMINGVPASFISVTASMPVELSEVTLTVVSQVPLVVRRVSSELLKTFDCAPLGLSAATPVASSFSLGNPSSAPFGARAPQSAGAPKGSQRWEKERDRMGSCGLSVINLRMSTMYVSGSVLFCLSKNAHSMGQGLHMQQRLGSFGGSMGIGGSRSLTVDQVCFSLASDANLPPDTAKSSQISGVMAEALTSNLLSNFALCQGGGGDSGSGSAGEGVFWTYTAGLVEQISGSRIQLTSKMEGAVGGTKLSNPTAGPTEVESTALIGADISIAETMEKMFDFLFGMALKATRIPEDSIGRLTESAVAILAMSIKRGFRGGVLCAFKLLKLCFVSDPSGRILGSNTAVRQARGLLFEFLLQQDSVTVDDASGPSAESVTTACCEVVTAGFETMCPSAGEQIELLTRITDGDLVHFEVLQTQLLAKLSSSINSTESPLNPVVDEEAFLAVVCKLLDWSLAAAVSRLEECRQYLVADGAAHFTAPAAVTALSRIQTHLFCAAVQSSNGDINSDSTHEVSPTRVSDKLVERYVLKVLECCKKIIDGLHSLAGETLSPQAQAMVAMAIKTTPCGFLLPTIIAACGPAATRTFAPCSAQLLETLENMVKSADSLAMVFGDEQRSLEAVKLPRPWERDVVAESIHPVRDNYKFSETFSIVGAKCLYMTFDQRCSSQYDYDKLIVYSGSPESGQQKPVGEFGGNTAGFGSRSVIGSGWPKAPLRVTGDTVHIEFEMKSGRESSTPDLAMWGFKISIRDREQGDTTKTAFPFHTDLMMSLAAWMMHATEEFSQAPRPEMDEERLFTTLNYDMFQGFQSDMAVANSESLNDIAADSKRYIPGDVWEQCVTAMGPVPRRDFLFQRKSVAAAVGPDELQDLFVAAAFNSVGALPTVVTFGSGDPDAASLKPLFVHVVKTLRACEGALLQMADHEERWNSDVADIARGTKKLHDAFFAGWHLEDETAKKLDSLCRLLGIPHAGHAGEQQMKDLLSVLGEEAAFMQEGNNSTADSEVNIEAKTMLKSPNGLTLHRLGVVANNLKEHCRFVLRGHQQSGEGFDGGVESDVYDDDDAEPRRTTSMSAPPVLEALNLGQRRTLRSASGSSERIDSTVRSHSVGLLDASFVPYALDSIQWRPVTAQELAAVATLRAARAANRCVALENLAALLADQAAGLHSGFLVQFLVEQAAAILARCASEADIASSGVSQRVRGAFERALETVTQVIERFPETCYRALSLCNLPLQPRQASCLTNSSIVSLLENLCTSEWPHVANTAWANVHALAMRTAMWRLRRLHGASARGTIETLSAQLSDLLRSQLDVVATEEAQSHLAAQVVVVAPDPATEHIPAKLQILHILDNLAGSQLGKEIVSHPVCVTALLQFLVDGRSTPKLLACVTRLLAVALPLISDDDSELANHLHACPSLKGTRVDNSDSCKSWAVQIILNKLSEVVVPPCRKYFMPPALVSRRTAEAASSSDDLDAVAAAAAATAEAVAETQGVPTTAMQKKSSLRFVVRLFRRPDQVAKDVIQPLMKLNRRMFHSGSRDSVDQLMRLDHELNEIGSAIAFRGSFAASLEIARDWATQGTLCSVEREPASNRPTAAVESSKAEIKLCKNLNEKLRDQAPKRFVDGAAAGGIAAGLIGLLQSLVTAVIQPPGARSDPAQNSTTPSGEPTPAMDATRPWFAHVEAALRRPIGALPEIARLLACDDGDDPTDTVVRSACLAVAALCAMGAVHESVHVGGHTIVGGHGLAPSVGQIESYEAERGHAYVQFPSLEYSLRVPAASLLSSRELPPAEVLGLLSNEIIAATDALLSVGSDKPVGVQSESASANREKVAFAHRLLADIRTRSCMLLCSKLRAGSVGAPSSDSCDTIRRLASESHGFTESSIPLAEAACTKVRQRFYEQFRPRIPLAKASSDNTTALEWDFTSQYPRCTGVLMHSNRTTLLSCRPAHSASKGKYASLVYANGKLPVTADYSYWEVTVEAAAEGDVQMSKLHEHPLAKNDVDNGWGCDGHAAPGSGCGRAMGQTVGVTRFRCVSGCDFDLCGDCVQVGSQECDTFRVGFASKSEKKEWKWPADTILFSSSGKVFCRGVSDAQPVEMPPEASLVGGNAQRVHDGDVIGCLLKGSKVIFSINGVDATLPIEVNVDALCPVVSFTGPNCQLATDLNVDLEGYPTECASEFAQPMDDGVDGSSGTSKTGPPPDVLPVNTVRTTSPMKVLGKYATQLSGFTMSSMPHVVFGDEEEEEEDMTERLIAAWEADVFPKIHGRFRSAAERQNGFEQIRGALQFNMPEVAVDTVAGLYDESGGLPADFHLPTMDDLKASAGRLSAAEIATGMRVRNISGSGSDTGFEVHGMAKTRNLTGTVLRVDTVRSLALVEIYVPMDATLAHWWLPCSVLESAETPLADTSFRASTHDDFLVSESKLIRLYCRSALIFLNQRGFVPLSTGERLRLKSYESREMPSPGQCFVRSAAAEDLFQSGSEASGMLKTAMSEAWVAALTEGKDEKEVAGTALALINNVCESLEITDEQCSFDSAVVSIADGRKVADIQFSSLYSDVVTSVRVSAEDAGNPVLYASDDGPWLRVYARNDADGPRAAVYPCVDTGVRLPTYVVPSARLHVRLSPQGLESVANLQVCFHALHRDLPLALAFIQGPVLHSQTAPPSILHRVAELLVAVLTEVEVSPYLREMLHHTLAGVLRKGGPAFSPDLRTGVAALYSGVATELPAVEGGVGRGSRSTSSTDTKVSTYFQSLVEVAIADRVNAKIYKLRHNDGGESDAERSRSSGSRSSRGSSSAGAGDGPSQGHPGPGKAKESKDGPQKLFEYKMSRKAKRSATAEKKRTKSGERSGERSGDKVSEFRSWVKRAADIEVLLRYILEDPMMTVGPDGERLMAPPMVTNMIEHSYARCAGVTVGNNLLGLSFTSAIDDEMLEALVRTAVLGSGGAIRLHVGREAAKSWRCVIVEVRSGTVVDRARLALRQTHKNHFASSQGEPRFFSIALAVGYGDTVVWEKDHPVAEEQQAQVATAVSEFLAGYLVEPDSADSSPEGANAKGGDAAPAAQAAPSVLVRFCAQMSTFLDAVLGPADGEQSCAAVSKADVLTADMEGGVPVVGEFSAATVAHLFSALDGGDADCIATRVLGIADGSESLKREDVLLHLLELCQTAPGTMLAGATAYGCDLRLQHYRHTTVEDALVAHEDWTSADDVVLVEEIKQISLQLGVPTRALSPVDLFIGGMSTTHTLARFPLEHVRHRMCIVLAINDMVSILLPVIDFRSVTPIPMSLADIYCRARYLFLHDLTVPWFNRVLNSTAERLDSNATAEIQLDPLETITSGGGEPSLHETQFIQALHQIEDIDPKSLRVRMPSGGDLVFPITVRLLGESVAGSSGSFREFLARMATELHSGAVPVMTECASATLGQNKGKFVIVPGDVDFLRARLFEFFGTLIGIAIRADVPMILDLLPSFWKSMVNTPLDETDLVAAHLSLMRQNAALLAAPNEADFDAIVSEKNVTLVYPSLSGHGELVDIGPDVLGRANAVGADTVLKFEYRKSFVEVCERRLKEELESTLQIRLIRKGLSLVVASELLLTMAPSDLEARVCGRPFIDVAFLRSQTTYSVGLAETDPHIVFFWNTLSSWPQDKLQKFIKFACNQDRVPSALPDDAMTTHVPPFPMKIAPPDSDPQGRPRRTDQLFIRAETCMFMVKLPQYSTQEVMRERLLTAVTYRGDPLNG